MSGREETKGLICISCPQGCALQVEVVKEDIRVSGNACRRGITYARAEILDPRRTITTTVRVRGGVLPLVPVRSQGPIPKGKIVEALMELREVVVEAPVAMHQAITPSVAGTGIAVVATRPVAAGSAAGLSERGIPG